MKVPLLDLKPQYESIRAEIDKAIKEVIESQHFINGPQVQKCEAAIAAYSQAAYGVGASSGTDALLMALMCEDIGQGDEVITSPYTFFASAGSIARLGATPVFVDIDPVTYNIDPRLLERKITARTKAIMPVHLYGQMADMDPIMEIAGRHKLVVVEDAAQSIGAIYKGKKSGSIGHYGCFSFFPSKNLGCFGDGGMVVTNDKNREEKLMILRNHGSKPKYYHKIIGGNFRLDTIQAAVVLAKLPYLDRWSAARQANAARYGRLFVQAGLAKPETPDAGLIKLPRIVSERHIFNQYVIRVPRRDQLKEFLNTQGISTEIYYPVALHLQECFAHLGYKPGDCPESEKAAQETLALPIFPELTDAQAEHIVNSIHQFYK